MNILMVEDSDLFYERFRNIIEEKLDGHRLIRASTLNGGLSEIKKHSYDLALVDLGLPRTTPGDPVEMEAGLEFIDEVEINHPELVVVVFSGQDKRVAVDCVLKHRVLDYLFKDTPIDELQARVQIAIDQALTHRRIVRRREEHLVSYGAHRLIGQSPPMVSLRELILKVAPRTVNVLIQGESGTGKELVARALHAHGPCPDGPFIAVNCAAVPDNLVESELFGHVKGAFTGAAQARPGKFLIADGGTLFLDEIGELSSEVQAKLLRVLEERLVYRLGSNRGESTSFRLVTATNRSLEEEVKEGRFRSDLLFRIKTFPIDVPPLRERSGDVEFLAIHFLRQAHQAGTTKATTFAPSALDLLRTHRWPGNVRELLHVVEHATIIEVGDTVTPSSLPRNIVCTESINTDENNRPATYPEALEEFERTFYRRALERNRGVVARTSRELAIPLRTFQRRLANLGIRADEFRTKEYS